MEFDVARSRRVDRADRAAVDAGRADAGEELAVVSTVTADAGPITLRKIEHVAIHRRATTESESNQHAAIRHGSHSAPMLEARP
jgi:hypothetical protein